MKLSQVQIKNFNTSRQVFDAWFDLNHPNGDNREDWWVRLVAALFTESGCLILAHTGVWGGGGYINSAQKAVLVTSANYPHDSFGSNGGSVGALQQIPTPVALLATDQFTGESKAWGGWGTIADCMALETSIPKFMNRLQVTSESIYKGKQTASPIVADLLRVQQPLASEVSANYGASIVSTATEIAAQFQKSTQSDWFASASLLDVAKSVR